MGKLVPLPAGQFATSFPAARSTTTIAWLAGSFTKIRVVLRSSWKLSGCAFSSISAANFAQRDFPFEQERRFIGPPRRNEESARNRKRRHKRFHRVVSSFSLIS